MRRAAATVLAALAGIAAAAAAPAARPSAASTSRWWKLECADACTFTVKLHGPIDPSRLQLVRRAVERRDRAQRSLGRGVALRVDLDSAGGEVFSGMEIGRVLRRERAAARVAAGAVCESACVFVLMGAPEREVAEAARVAIHRPSLGEDGEAATVASMANALVLYAREMGLSREIVDAMMAVPPQRLRVLSRAELARYGLVAAGPLARGR